MDNEEWESLNGLIYMPSSKHFYDPKTVEQCVEPLSDF